MRGNCRCAASAPPHGYQHLNRGCFYGLNRIGWWRRTLLDHVYAFSVFGNGGVMIGEAAPPAQLIPGFRTLNPVAVKQIRNSKGDIIKIYDRRKRSVLSRKPPMSLPTL
jgi:hypothetical protein